MKRRKFLQTVGEVCLTAPLVAKGLALSLQGESTTPASSPMSIEDMIISSCSACPNHCSLKVRRVGDRAVGISGNPLHPINRGHLCARGNAALEEIFHPDRLLHPLKRTGDRGSGDYQPIGWDEALNEIAAALQALRSKGSEKLVVLRRETRDSFSSLAARFMKAYGSPNDLVLRENSANSAIYLMQGVREAEGYDIENSQYVLCFGADLLNTGSAPVYFNGAFSRFRRTAGRSRGRWVQVEPQLSLTGNKADQWVPVRPGSEGALALGIAYVLIKRNLCDAEFIRRQTFGFEDWLDDRGQNHQGFQSLVLRDYSVYRVSEITGVPAITIEQLAYDLATRKPAVAIPGGHFSQASNSAFTQMAVHALNALIGSIDRPGGVIIQRSLPFTELPEPVLDDEARRALSWPRVDDAGSVLCPMASSAPERLPDNLLSGKPYRPELLMVLGGNPLYGFAEVDKLREALAQVPLIVSFNAFPDETSRWADIILPTTCFLEDWGNGTTPTGAALTSTLSLRKPAVHQVGEARSPGDILLTLARCLGGNVAQALPWNDYQEYLRESLAGLFHSGTGYITNGSFDTSWLKTLKGMGWHDPGYENFDQFWAQLEEKGGWWDPVYSHGHWNEVFQTPSGKFEFYSLALKNASSNFSPETVRVDPSQDIFCLPHYEEPILQGDPQKYPFVLLLYEVQHRRGDHSSALASMQEIPNTPHDEIWETRVEISPAVAEELHLEEHQLVWVESPRGKIQLPIRIYPGATDRAVAIALGGGHTHLGRWAEGIGANPHTLRPLVLDLISGMAALTCTRVKIYRA